MIFKDASSDVWAVQDINGDGGLQNKSLRIRTCNAAHSKALSRPIS